MPLSWSRMSFFGSQKHRTELAEEGKDQEAGAARARRGGSRQGGNGTKGDNRSMRTQREDVADDNVRVPDRKQGMEAHGQERVTTRRPASEDDRVDLPSSSSSIPIDAQTESTRQCDACRTWQSQKEEMESIVKQRCQQAYQLDLELQSATKRLAEWEESYAKLEQRLKFSNAQADERIAEPMEKENRELRRVEKENQELRQVEKENQMLHDEGIKMQRQLEQLTKQSERREENLHKLQKLLESRTEELKLAQTFLTTADQHSIADVCHMVNQLNEEIYQCTMMMSDALIEQRRLQDRKDVDKAANRQVACERAELRWGKALVSRLQADVSTDETTLLESLLQHVLMRWCYEIVQSFSLESREFDNRFLALWDSIAQAYETPIAKRWLAITHSQLKSPIVNHSGIMNDLAILMVTGGWSNEMEGCQALPQKVLEKVRELSERASKIKEAIIEGILSVEVDVFYHEDGTLYDPSTMQDAWDIGAHSGAAGSSAAEIICSTGLGVRYITRDRHSSAGERGQGKEAVLKPKVLLPSALEVVN
ncbi:hypothetical protein FA13DRAFT_1725555 [Coprinellus micaceus]|uniref:Uncharacterized protein n=1 Tax=Coprinellus micaceus TaxID=71717 RepID=A0A4Y7TVB9_COPMI|nr:hypothetical protein FA13DRAFT_1725555 [Coprinellus micaceus]